MVAAPGAEAELPDSGWYRERTAAFRAVKRLEDARRVAHEGLARFPDDYGLHCELALVLTDLREVDDALRIARRACGLSDRPEWAYRVLSAIQRTQGPGRAAQAIESARRALEFSSGEWQVYVALSLAYRNARRYSEAHDYAELGVKAAPQLYQPYVELAWTLIGVGASTEAVMMARRALSIDPESADAHHVLGVALGETGRTKEAEVSLLTAKRIAPMRRGTEEALVRISKRRGAVSPHFVRLLVLMLALAVGAMSITAAELRGPAVIGLIVAAVGFARKRK